MVILSPMEQLREWRLSRPDVKTLEAAGRLLGVSAVQVFRYESGERAIPPQRVLEVAELTGIPPHILRPDVFPVPHKDAGK